MDHLINRILFPSFKRSCKSCYPVKKIAVDWRVKRALIPKLKQTGRSPSIGKLSAGSAVCGIGRALFLHSV